MTRQIGIVLVLLAPLCVVGQTQWKPPRTADGQPDLQGLWTNETITPFERPSQLAGKAFLTEEEAAELEQRTAERRAEGESNPRPGVVGSYNRVWFDSGTKVLSTRQTSLVVDPPDGRVPVRPEAEETRDDNFAHSTDSYEYMSVWDRCLSRGIPGSVFPAGYNNAYRILQVPGYVVILYEMIHDARIIPLDPRPHIAPNIRQWMGDARGRWRTIRSSSRPRPSTTGAGLRRVVRADASRVSRRATLFTSSSASPASAKTLSVRSHDRGSARVHETLDRGDAVDARPGLSDLRVRVSRGESSRDQHPRRSSRSGEDSIKEEVSVRMMRTRVLAGVMMGLRWRLGP